MKAIQASLETEERNYVKIAFLGTVLIGCIAWLYHLIDFSVIAAWWNDETKGELTEVVASIVILSGFALFKAIFGHKNHKAEETLMHVLHVNFIMLALMPDSYVKKIDVTKQDAKSIEEAEKLHNYYLAGLFIVAGFIFTLVIPAVGLLRHWSEGSPTTFIDTKGWFGEKGVEHNALVIFFYAIGYLLRLTVLAYLTFAVICGHDSVKPGHVGFLCINKKRILAKKEGDGSFLTFPFLGFISLWQEQTEFTIECISEIGTDKDSDHLYVKSEGIFFLEDANVFLEKKLSMGAVKLALKSFMQNALIEAVMSTKNKEDMEPEERYELWKKLMNKSVQKKLEDWDDCITLKTSLNVNELRFSATSGEKMKKLFLKAA